MGLTCVCVMNSSLSFGENIDILPVPHHPNKFKFSKHLFGKAKIVEQSFQPTVAVLSSGHSCIMMKLRIVCFATHA